LGFGHRDAFGWPLPYRGGLRPARRKTRKNQDIGALWPHGAALQLVRRPLYSRTFGRRWGGRRRRDSRRTIIADTEAFHVHFACICTGWLVVRRRQRQHAGVAAPLRPDLRHHVLP